MKKLLFPVLSLVLASCSTLNRGAAPVAIGPAEKSATLVAGRSGAYVALLPKGTLSLQLQSNPSAGYTWKLAKPLDASVLKLVSSGSSTLPPIALAPTGPTTPMPETWVFKAVGPGTQKVRMIYSRPDQPLSDAVTYDFTVNAE